MSGLRCGDLAEFAGVSPGDVLDMTAHLAHRWEHPDEQGSWREFSDVVKWMRQAAHGIDAADVEIVIWQAGVEEIVEALGVRYSVTPQ